MGHMGSKREEIMKLVIDTSVIIDTLRGGKQWDTYFSAIEKEAELFLPTAVIFELYSGLSTRSAKIEKRIQLIPTYFQRVDLTERIAKQAGKFFRDAKERVSLSDYIIAATAIEIGAEIVTLNRKHFEKIPGARIYDADNEI